MAISQDHIPPIPPSAAALAFAAALVAGITGYFLGQASSIGIFGGSKNGARELKSHTSDSSGDEDYEKLRNEWKTSDEDQEIKDFAANEECKLVLVVRTDLGMTKGKIAAQCGHATLACYKHFLRKSPNSTMLKRWERYGQMKVALQVKSEEDMEMLQAQATSLGLCAQVIHDAGRTQIASGSATVLGIGPGPKSVIDQVTGHLKLL
ncbi:peptidyl-tRNA hydrolase [Pseudovirgaria hyperparasitica]|uniref:peptidyl-tRNA hydrolase n=1 Tax=Pseudovirgaria hyperparasitica TaxID=470096 RepID=A0A6A6WCJ2_9PEZI|nr:peptidyl-tRNA hydrolase [Pseudovirgaria hyperparasitica]KAF2760548.1 peptidyl-tRNA hydrolase [Pseudovirgaria hyperparasitica]